MPEPVALGAGWASSHGSVREIPGGEYRFRRGPNAGVFGHSGTVVYRNAHKPGYELRLKVVPGKTYGDDTGTIVIQAEEFGPSSSGANMAAPAAASLSTLVARMVRMVA